MLSNKKEVKKITKSVDSAIETILHLPEDIAHYNWDAYRIETAFECLEMARNLLDDTKDTNDLLKSFERVSRRFKKVQETY